MYKFQIRFLGTYLRILLTFSLFVFPFNDNFPNIGFQEQIRPYITLRFLLACLYFTPLWIHDYILFSLSRLLFHHHVMEFLPNFRVELYLIDLTKVTDFTWA